MKTEKPRLRVRAKNSVRGAAISLALTESEMEKMLERNDNFDAVKRRIKMNWFLIGMCSYVILFGIIKLILS